MCFNMALIITKTELIERFGLTTLDAAAPDEIVINNISGFTRPPWPLITQEGGDRITTGQWGLIPHWVKEEKQAADISLKTLNARSETIREKPSFKYSVKSRRCLIPVSGFYEPHHHEGKSYPFYLTRENGGVFTLAGLTASWRGNITFSVITAPANSLLAKVHNKKKRMPVVFFDRDEERAWLDPHLCETEMNRFFTDREHPEMTGWPVAPFYGRGETDTPGAWERHHYGIEAVDGLLREST